VEARASELGLTDIVFTGNVPHTEVAAWYSIIDVVVYPRIRAVITERVTPLKPLEVMAMEKVCVGSDVGGLTELIDDGRTGMIFRSGDASHLAEVLITLKSDPMLMKRLGAAALDYVRTEREWLVIARKYQTIYKELTQSRQKSNTHISE
jgi:glycosyltransferase involved in cell wall biosynthesis